MIKAHHMYEYQAHMYEYQPSLCHALVFAPSQLAIIILHISMV